MPIQFETRFLQKASLPTGIFPITASNGAYELNGFTVIPLDQFVEGSGSGNPKVAVKSTDEDKDSKDKDKKKDKPEAKSKDKPKKESPKDEPKDTPMENGSKVDPDFGFGAKVRPVSDEEMDTYLHRIKDKKKLPLDKYKMPYVHHKSIQIVDGSGKELDLVALKASIKKRPSKLLRENEKMQHSGGKTTQFFNVGLPALKGLVVNEKTDEFVIVDTCPGSGVCKTFCYALKGYYVMFKHTNMMLTQTLNFLVNEPKRFEARLKAEIAAAIVTVDEGVDVVIRWHDAGDFFSPQYANLAFNVAKAFPDTKFYAYTKLAEIAISDKPDNFLISFSDGALPEEQKRVDMTQIKHSVVVPQKMFWDLIVVKGAHSVKIDGQVRFKDEASWDEFKDRMVKTYKIRKHTILIYDQYMKLKEKDELGDKPMKWNVVVPPGAGDNSANDVLVAGSYLMFH